MDNRFYSLLGFADKKSKSGVLNANLDLAREHHNLKGECVGVLISALQEETIALDELDTDILGKVQSMAKSTKTDFDEVWVFLEAIFSQVLLLFCWLYL